MATSRPQDWMSAFRRSHGLASTAQTTAQAAQASASSASSSASAAQAAAATAATNASSALTLANNAQTSANGKNTVFYSTSSPTANAVNDTWFQTSGGTIIGVYQWSGSAWTPKTLTNATIANLDAGKISTGTLTGINVIGNNIETAANVGTGTSPSIVPGVLMNTTGIYGYDAVFGNTFTLSGGSLSLFGGNLTSSTITGAILQTAASGKRVQIDATNFDSVKFYSGDASEATNGYLQGGVSGTGTTRRAFTAMGSPALNPTVAASTVNCYSGSAGGAPAIITIDAGGSTGEVDFTGLINASNLGTGTGTTVIVGSAGYLRALSSSRRYKTKIRTYTADPDVLKIKPKAWVYKTEPDTPQVGPIAEDVEKIAPELVYHNEKGQPESVDKGAIAMVQIQALLDRIDAQDKRIRALERQLAKK